jgi:hypothetical protein
MSTPPPKGWSKLQALVLAEIKAYDRSTLRHTSQIKITTMSGEEIYESHDSLYVKVLVKGCIYVCMYVWCFGRNLRILYLHVFNISL